ncbi:MAG: glycosyltransferase family 4 protein, partial [Verrucomicrobiota bacterium]
WFPRFDAERFRVLLCSRRGYDKAAEQMERSGIQPMYLGYGKFDIRNFFKLCRIVREEKVDLIQAHGYGACLWGHLASIRFGIPLIVHARCNYRTVPWFQRPIERLFGPRTKHALAVSESTRDFCIRKRHIPAEVIEVLYNGMPMESIQPQSEDWIRETRKKYGADETTKVICIVGRLETYKGLLDAFEAFRRVADEVPEAVLWVAGDGPYEAALHPWIAEHGMGDRIKLLGFLPDIRDVMWCFDVQLFPSHREGTPNTLFEALAVGSAIVASTTDGQGEILEHEKTGLVFEPGDIETMTEHLRRILGEAELRATLSANAREKSKDFDGQKTVERMQEK